MNLIVNHEPDLILLCMTVMIRYVGFEGAPQHVMFSHALCRRVHPVSQRWSSQDSVSTTSEKEEQG